jgi:hypothetical protein
VPQEALGWIARTRAGDLASIAGLVVSIVGFAFTLYNVVKSRTAAEAAEAAARATRKTLSTYDSIAAISAAIAAINDVRRLHRDAQWLLLPDRYSTLRQSLIAIRSGPVVLTGDQLSLLQSAIQLFAELERQVDRAIVHPERAPDRVKLNQLVSAQSDRLTELLTQLRNAGGPNGE